MSYHDFKMMLLALTLSGIGLGFIIGLMVATLFFS